jgi:hypothetical protein
MDNQENKNETTEKTPSNVIPINQSKKKLAKQIAEKGNEIKTIEGKINLLNNIVMGQANFMKQIMDEIDSIKRNLVETTTTLYTLIEDHLSIDMNLLQENVDKKKIEMFVEGTLEEDKREGKENDEEGIVKEDSTVIVTSTINPNGKTGILRSRLDLTRPISVPDLKENLVGMKVNETKEIKVNDTTHNITVLEVKKLIPAQPAEEKKEK